MINAVPKDIIEEARMETLKHPDAMDCVIYRMVLLRTTGETLIGLSDLGVLNDEDEDEDEDEGEFEYQALGPAKILMKGKYQGCDMVDNGDALVPDSLLEALIECVDAPGFEIKKDDMVMVMLGGGVVIGFEIVGVTDSADIYPYTKRWVVSPREELHSFGPDEP